MAQFILDTTTLTHLRRNHPRVVANLAAHQGHLITVTAVNVDEMLGGWYSQLRAARTNAQRSTAYDFLAQATSFFARFPILVPSEAALDRVDQLMRLRLNVGRMDLTIAAIAREVGAAVVTNNVRDFTRVPNLVVVDWSV
jgi:tRNA(fMet)-specific endonuclease VapC